MLLGELELVEMQTTGKGRRASSVAVVGVADGVGPPVWWANTVHVAIW